MFQYEINDRFGIFEVVGVMADGVTHDAGSRQRQRRRVLLVIDTVFFKVTSRLWPAGSG